MTGPTLDEFAAYVEELPGSSASFWGDRAGIGLYPMLGWLNTHPVVLQREALVEEGSAVAAVRMTRPHHNQVGTAVAWATKYLTGPGRTIHIEVEDLPDLFDLAGRAWALRNLIAEARQGVRGFEAHDRRVQMPFLGDARLDALDRLLDVVDDVEQVTADTRSWSPEARRWFADGQTSVPWRGTPPWLRREFQAYSAWLIGNYPSYLRADLDVGGFTIGDATAVLQELLARALHAHLCLVYGSSSVKATIPAVEADLYVRDLAKCTGVRQRAVEPIVDLLTLDLTRCPDPCLTPLVPVMGNLLVPMSSLILPSSPVRNFTRLLQADPKRFGAAGRELGALGTRTVATTLERLAGSMVTTGVQVLRRDRSKAGDLDVVAFDPASRSMAIFEVLWRIGPDGSEEVAAIENAAHAKRAQVARIRADIASGTAAPRWPAHWPDVTDVPARWFVLTPDVLPVRSMETDGIVVRSNQMLKRTLGPGSTVAELIALMDSPPYPGAELIATSWHDLQYGEFSVEFDLSNSAPG